LAPWSGPDRQSRPTCITGNCWRKMTASGEATAMQAYDPEEFRRFGHAAVDLLADSLSQAQSGIGPVLPPRTPEAVLERWPAPTERQPRLETLRQALEQSNHLHHPRYLGHQVSAPLPAAALCDLVGSLLNNGTAVFEMGPVTSILERRLIEWMAITARAQDGLGSSRILIKSVSRPFDAP